MEIACSQTQILVHNTNKLLPDWQIDYTTDSPARFRPLSIIEDYDPYYIDPDYNRDLYWNEELYDQQNIQFHHNYQNQDDDVDTDEPINNNMLTNALIHLWEPNPIKYNKCLQPKDGNELKTQDETSLIDESIFANVLISTEGHTPYVPLSTNLGLKYKRRMLYFPMGFGELTIDGLVDTGALTSAIPESDLRKIKLLTTQSIIKEGPPPGFQIMVANEQLEKPKATLELKFEVGDIEFHEIFIVRDNLTGPIIGLMFLQRNHTELDMREEILFSRTSPCN